MEGRSVNAEALRADLARVRHPIDEAASLPPACYSDETLFAIERDAIFHASWIGIGRADRWRKPGDYSAMQIAGVPTIVLRDQDGGLRAFANSCRHRGARLLEGDGNCRGVKCPFHGWAYKLDGRLAGAPRMEHTKNFDKTEFALVPFAVAEREGFAFLSYDAARDDIDDWLGDFAELHGPWSLADLVSTRRREFEVKCNWKNFVEVFNEYYHLPYVHPDTVDSVYDLPDDPDPTTGAYASQFGATQGTGGLLEDQQEHVLPPIASLTGRNRQGVRYTWAFPNMTFAAGTEAMWVYEVYPLAPNRTHVAMTACFPPETVESDGFKQSVQFYYDRLDAAIAEDIPALESQQIGLTSPFARQGRFSFLEPNVAEFACWYADKIGKGLAGGTP
jgi:phenylpropionate dioxygenase-like ring-hydroxylating dioxygenase large terminal subunit